METRRPAEHWKCCIPSFWSPLVYHSQGGFDLWFNPLCFLECTLCMCPEVNCIHCTSLSPFYFAHETEGHINNIYVACVVFTKLGRHCMTTMMK